MLRVRAADVEPPRHRIEEQAQARAEARERVKTAAFATTYAQREGVEGTLAFGTRACGLRRARSIGLARTRLQHLLTGAAINFLRLGRWLVGATPATTRRTAFIRLMHDVAAT